MYFRLCDMFLTFGRGCLFAQAVEEKVVTKSSAESEISAVSDCAGHGLCVMNMLKSVEISGEVVPTKTTR